MRIIVETLATALPTEGANIGQTYGGNETMTQTKMKMVTPIYVVE